MSNAESNSETSTVSWGADAPQGGTAQQIAR